MRIGCALCLSVSFGSVPPTIFVRLNFNLLSKSQLSSSYTKAVKHPWATSLYPFCDIISHPGFKRLAGLGHPWSRDTLLWYVVRCSSNLIPNQQLLRSFTSKPPQSFCNFVKDSVNSLRVCYKLNFIFLARKFWNHLKPTPIKFQRIAPLLPRKSRNLRTNYVLISLSIFTPRKILYVSWLTVSHASPTLSVPTSGKPCHPWTLIRLNLFSIPSNLPTALISRQLELMKKKDNRPHPWFEPQCLPNPQFYFSQKKKDKYKDTVRIFQDFAPGYRLITFFLRLDEN